MQCLKSVAEGVEITVKVVPGASRDGIVGPLGDALKLRVSAPPERGRANAAVEALLANALGVTGRDVSVIKGRTSPRKTVLVRKLSIEQVANGLGAEP